MHKYTWETPTEILYPPLPSNCLRIQRASGNNRFLRTEPEDVTREVQLAINASSTDNISSWKVFFVIVWKSHHLLCGFAVLHSNAAEWVFWPDVPLGEFSLQNVCSPWKKCPIKKKAYCVGQKPVSTTGKKNSRIWEKNANVEESSWKTNIRIKWGTHWWYLLGFSHCLEIWQSVDKFAVVHSNRTEWTFWADLLPSGFLYIVYRYLPLNANMDNPNSWVIQSPTEITLLSLQ